MRKGLFKILGVCGRQEYHPEKTRISFGKRKKSRDRGYNRGPYWAIVGQIGQDRRE